MVFLSNSYAEIIPPNFDFKFNDFNLFMPGALRKGIEKKYTDGKEIKLSDSLKVMKYQLKNARYSFFILVQYQQGKVTDFYTRLPSYFSHDVFHQSIINRFGKQDLYKKIEEQAIYIWNKKSKNKHFYSGACTITCFPVYYSVQAKKLNNDSIHAYFLKDITLHQNLKDL